MNVYGQIWVKIRTGNQMLSMNEGDVISKTTAESHVALLSVKNGQLLVAKKMFDYLKNFESGRSQRP